MVKINFNEEVFDCKEQENLLDAFFRNKIDIPFSCRNGSCQACLIQVVSGEIPIESQVGLSQYLKQSKHLLPCRCYPSSDMQLKPLCLEDIYNVAIITNVSYLSEYIAEVSIQPNNKLQKFKTGQFINIKTHLDNKIRSYSLTNSYGKNEIIKIHVQKITEGVFSSWIFQDVNIGDSVQLHYPLGECPATKNCNSRGKLLIATGSGLGAIVAIAKEALTNGYEKEICLYHSSKHESGLYFKSELQLLSKTYKNFKFKVCVSNEQPADKNIPMAYVDSLAFQCVDTLKNWEVYLYGNPVMVKSATKKAMTFGCDEMDIFSDSFDYGERAQYNKSDAETNRMEFIEEDKRFFEPNLKMWKALGNGERLNQILDDFYTKVLADPLLSPFFKGVTKGHIMGKQYSFLNQIFTGKDCYFGDRPRNAHHWMIISDSLFDHREKLFADSCIKCGLKEPYLSQLLAFDESYRETIVKTKVWPRITDGEIKPIKGFEEMILDIGSICDGCEKELEPGEKIHYHDRTGELFCQECQSI